MPTNGRYMMRVVDRFTMGALWWREKPPTERTGGRVYRGRRSSTIRHPCEDRYEVEIPR